MEKHDDAPEDVKRATSVVREIKRGEKDDTFEGYPRAQERKKRWEHCDNTSSKKSKKGQPSKLFICDEKFMWFHEGFIRAQKAKSDGDCCQRRGEKRTKNKAKFTRVSVFGEPCTFPKLDIVPRHCLTRQEYINMLATESRRCPPDCHTKTVLRKLRPVSPRIKELAQPTRQRMLIALQQGATILPPALIDNLVKTLENETCLTPEQAARVSRKKRFGKKKKVRTDKWSYKETSKSRKPSIGAVSTGSFDKDAVSCLYLMAERFVKSILQWQCPIPRTEFNDLSKVIVRRLVDTLEYTSPQDEDRKSQQLRFLADVIACWISGVLSEVAQEQEKKLKEWCKTREDEIKAAEEEEVEEEQDDDEQSRKDDEEKDPDEDWDLVSEEEEEKGEEGGEEEKREGEEEEKGEGGRKEGKEEEEYKLMEGEEKSKKDVETMVEKKPEQVLETETQVEEEKKDKEVIAVDVGIETEEVDAQPALEEKAEKEETLVKTEMETITRSEAQVRSQTQAGTEGLGEAEAETGGQKPEEKAEAEVQRQVDEPTVQERKVPLSEKAGEEQEKTVLVEAVRVEGKPVEEQSDVDTTMEEVDAKLVEDSREQSAETKVVAETVEPGVETASEQATVEAEKKEDAEAEPEAETKGKVELAAEMQTKPELEAETEVDVNVEAESGAEPGVEPAVEPGVEAVVKPGVEAAVEPGMEAAVEPGVEPGVESEAKETKGKAPSEVSEAEKASKDIDVIKNLEELLTTDLPFLTFGKIIDTVYKMIENTPENTGEDSITNGIHRAIYEKLKNIVMVENSELLTEELEGIMDVVCGKIANWLRTILSESQIAFMERYVPVVESMEIRDWMMWLMRVSDAAKDWNVWLRGVIETIFEMEGAEISRGKWQDWTRSVDSGALLWRRFHLRALHRARRNVTMMIGRRVVKTGTANKLSDLSEKLLHTTDLQA